MLVTCCVIRLREWFHYKPHKLLVETMPSSVQHCQVPMLDLSRERRQRNAFQATLFLIKFLRIISSICTVYQLDLLGASKRAVRDVNLCYMAVTSPNTMKTLQLRQLISVDFREKFAVLLRHMDRLAYRIIVVWLLGNVSHVDQSVMCDD